MSIKPVDFQISVPRTLEVSKISSAEIQKNAAIQQQQAMQTQNITEKNLRQVYAKDRAENVAIRERQSGSKSREDGRKKEKKKNEENSKTSSGQSLRGCFAGGQTSTIDIKL